MKSALLVITFLTPGGGETRWTEQTGMIAVCHGRALELGEWAASQGVRIRYSCLTDLTVTAKEE
jgi:hypothetical protein